MSLGLLGEQFDPLGQIGDDPGPGLIVKVSGGEGLMEEVVDHPGCAAVRNGASHTARRLRPAGPRISAPSSSTVMSVQAPRRWLGCSSIWPPDGGARVGHKRGIR